MRALIPLLVLACSPDDPLRHLDAPSGPPVRDLTLTAPPEFQRDRPATVRIDGVRPGDQVALVAAANVGGPDACPAIIAPDCLDVPQNFVVIGTARANNAGVVHFDIEVPDNLPPDDLLLQAVSPASNGLHLSPVTQVDVIDALPILDPDFVILTGAFAYNPNNDIARSWYSGATLSDVSVTVVLAEQGWRGYADTTRGCVTVLDAPGTLPRAPWSNTVPDALYGVDLPPDPVVTGDCAARVDPNQFPDFNRVLREAEWQLGFTRDVSPSYANLLMTQAGYSQSDIDSYLGMLWGGDIGDAVDFNGFGRDGLTAAFQVDSSWTLVIDPATASLVRLDAGPLTSGPRPGRAMYSSQFTLNTVFLETLF